MGGVKKSFHWPKAKLKSRSHDCKPGNLLTLKSKLGFTILRLIVECFYVNDHPLAYKLLKDRGYKLFTLHTSQQKSEYFVHSRWWIKYLLSDGLRGLALIQ